MGRRECVRWVVKVAFTEMRPSMSEGVVEVKRLRIEHAGEEGGAPAPTLLTRIVMWTLSLFKFVHYCLDALSRFISPNVGIENHNSVISQGTCFSIPF